MENENTNKRSFFLNKGTIIAGFIGIIIGIVLFFVLDRFFNFTSKTLITSKAGKISEKTLYSEMKKDYPISYVLNIVNRKILEKKYKDFTDEQTEEFNTTINQIFDTYKSYGLTEEDFLSDNGFESKEEFIDNMKFSYRLNLYYIEYFKSIISKDEIEAYYNGDDIYGQISTKHMLVQTSSDDEDTDALKTANEIIAKLNAGANFDDVANEYGSKIISENVDFDYSNASSVDAEYVNASKELEIGEYTKTPVLSSYGYHVIYCINKEEKPSLEQVEEDIVKTLGIQLQNEDSHIIDRALIKLREQYNVKFKDKDLQKQYEVYCEELTNNV